MATPKPKPQAATIDDYLAAVNADQRAALQKLRQTIRAAAPQADECINYGVPAFRANGKSVVGFGAAKNHCSFFPMTGHTVADFAHELQGFQTSKGAIQFTPDRPLPAALLKKIVKARLAEIGAQSKTPAPKTNNDPIAAYSKAQSPAFRTICNRLHELIDAAIPKATSKVWHGGPVWFIGENPVVGYDATAKEVKLLFWNGLAFAEPDLKPVGKYGAAQATFQDAAELNLKVLRRWLKKARSDVFDSKAFFQKMRERK